MTKAADPVAGPRPFEGSRPACLDRIPGWERTRLAVASGDSADSVGVRLSGVVLRALGKAGARLNRRRRMAEPRHANTRGSARRRDLTDICGAGGGQDAEGRASSQRRSRNPGARTCRDRHEGLVAIHSAHPLPSRCRQLTEEHRKKPKDPGRAGQLLFPADFCSRTARVGMPGPQGAGMPGPRRSGRPGREGPAARTATGSRPDRDGPACRAPEAGQLRSWSGPGPPARRTPPAHPRR
jgi:hypothetical protein